MLGLWITLGVVALLVVWAIAIFNTLQRKRIEAQSAWSDIDVQLKRRYDLIPNLVNTVKGYAGHEKQTLESVIAARQQAIDARGIEQQVGAENMLTQALGRLFALAEAYPDLKANTNFMQLQEELTATENKIGFSRQHYNDSSAQYNQAMATFPSNVVAGMFGFKAMPYFEIEDPTHKAAPKVEF